VTRRIASKILHVTGRLAAVYGIAMAVILYTPVVDWLMRPLVPLDQPARGDIIVMLTAWAMPSGDMNEPGLRRAIAAERLYREGAAPSILITGSPPTSEDEGNVLTASARFLEEIGIPAASIAIEDRSYSTRDSAVNVASLARARGWKRVVLVTDGSHMLRARLAFEHEGLEVAAAPTMMWRVYGARPTVRFEKFGAVVHEYGGLLYYRARGWI
jgi:uncharacterized SAM-binding protein YcdF (DUF218 family)